MWLTIWEDGYLSTVQPNQANLASTFVETSEKLGSREKMHVDTFCFAHKNAV